MAGPKPFLEDLTDGDPRDTGRGTPDGSIRVMLADDDGEIRSTLKRLLEMEPDCRVVGEAGDAEEAIRVATECTPDVALVDISMPAGGGPAAAGGIRSVSPRTKLIALSAHEDDSSIRAMLGEGIHAYLTKGGSQGSIVDAIRAAVAGESVLSPRVATKMVHELSARLRREREEQESRQSAVERIRAVLDGSGMAVVFQPIVDMRSRRPLGAEALARFTAQPRRSPAQWFHEAHQVGLGIDLELMAIRAAVEAAARLPRQLYLSLNASPDAILSGRLIPLVDRTLRDRRLFFEVTEEAAVADYEALLETVEGMRARGVGLAVDDAGAGYASFRHILELAPDVIKLDMTLVRHIDRASPRRALAVALSAFAAQIDASITAEGVETEGEAATLLDIGVTVGQGFLFGSPAPVSAFS